MSPASSTFPSSLEDTRAGRPRSVMPALVLGIAAIVACLAWGPALQAVAQRLRPSQLDDISKYSDAELQALIDPARLQMWIITIASFCVIASLAVLAFVLGRRALRVTADDGTLARLGRWAPWPLVGGLVLVVAGVLFGSLAAAFAFLVLAFAMAGAMCSFILSGFALCRPPAKSAQGDGQSQAWRRSARVCLVAAPLVLLSVFLFLALLAQVTIGLYLRFHFVY